MPASPLAETAESARSTAPPPPPWLPETKSTEPRRPPLRLDAIVDAATTVLDRDGLDALTMRSVAAQLSTSVSALYKHVHNKEHLLQLLLDRVVSQLTVPAPNPDHWQDQVKDLARQMRHLLAQHRDLARLTLGRVPLGPNFVVSLEKQLAILRSGGLPDHIVAYAGDLVGLYVGAFAVEESFGKSADQANGPDSFQQMLQKYFASLPPDDFPNVTDLAVPLSVGGYDERFELGLDVLVRGLASFGS